jgi:hypothetical protein
MSGRLFFIPLLFLSTFVWAQSGGNNTYEFLNLPAGSRIAALGGNNVSHYDDDLNFVLNNPGLLRPELNEKVVLNFINYLSDINFGYVSYAKNFDKIGMFAAGIQYINYGNFIHADETGEILGDFVPAEYSFNIAYSLPISDKFTAGTNLKFIYSDFWSYFSSGMAFDAGVSYIDTAKLLSAGLVIKNIGLQLKPYTPGFREPLPYDVQIGVTKKLAHAPLRFSVTAQDLLRWDLDYVSVFNNSYELNTSTPDTTFRQKFATAMNNVGQAGDELIRHVLIGAEIVPHPNFYIALGYNYRRRTELSLQTAPKLVGMSIGFGLKLTKFNLNYSLASYHVAGASHHFSVGLNLAAFYKKSDYVIQNIP